jgi:hypothetical protein
MGIAKEGEIHQYKRNDDEWSRYRPAADNVMQINHT